MRVRFPAELVDAFLEQILPESNDAVVDESTFTTLLACTLTSRYFASAARRRLFSSIIIDLDRYSRVGRTAEEMMSRINTLIELLSDEQSDMALLVRRLEIGMDEDLVIEESSNLNGLLGTLCARALNLSCIDFTSGSHNILWEGLPSRTRDLLLDLFRLCPISRLQLSFLRDIPSAIATIQRCPRLQHIELIYANFVATVSHLEALPNLPDYAKYHIRYLSSGELCVTGIDVHIFSHYDKTSLYKLLSLERVATSLETCIVHVINGDFNPPLSGFNLEKIPQLRRLVIQQSKVDVNQFVSRTVKIVQHGNAMSKLKEIEFDIGTSIEYKGPYSTASDIDYGLFKGLQSNSFLKKHPLVQTFIFRVYMRLWSKVNSEEARNAGHPIPFEPKSVITIKERVQKNIVKAFTDDVLLIAPPGDGSLWRNIQVLVEVHS